MTNKTKILLRESEIRALRGTKWSDYIDNAVFNDHSWGVCGSGPFAVVYFNVEFTPTQLISMGMDIQKQIILSQL